MSLDGSNADFDPSRVAGVDGCQGGWLCFRVEIASKQTCVEFLNLADLLRNRPLNLLYLGIDIPIGLLDGERACDKAARRLLGRPRGSSVFPAPCRAALEATSYDHAKQLNCDKTGKKVSQQAWAIIPKIREIDAAMSSEVQTWAFEIHPEVCLWAMNGHRPMRFKKTAAAGQQERLALLLKSFPDIQTHLRHRPLGVGIDDVLDGAAAAWTALRRHCGQMSRVCRPERDDKGLNVEICYLPASERTAHGTS